MSSWRDYAKKVVPYVPGEQPAMKFAVKLNTNENPYPPAPGVSKALEQFPAESLRLYPDPEARGLVRAIAARYGVESGQVFVGVGSDDVLATAFLTFFTGGKKILFPDVTYSFYPVWADCYGIPYEKVPLDAEWKIDPAQYTGDIGGIIFANPNAPTGIALPLDGVREILEQNREVLVIVDEAYVDFGGESAVSLLDEYDNLLVVQTFSKSRSLAGLRIGYALGSEEMIRALMNVRCSINSYTMSRPAIEAGTAALEDEEYFNMTLDAIVDTREETKEALTEMGFTCLDSQANFLFVTHPDAQAEALYRELKDREVFVRYFAQPRIDNWLRITVGTPRQMQILLDALRRILHAR